MAMKFSRKLAFCTAAFLAAVIAPPAAFAQASCPSDMKEVRVGKSVSCVPEEAKVTAAKEILKDDPKFAEFVKGKWDVIHPKNAKPGEFCGAIFQNKDAMIWVMGPGGDYRGALLRFYGADIPKPSNPDKNGMGRQRITLTQAPDPAQTLTVLNHAYNEFAFGVLSIPVPSLDALVGAMAEDQHFRIEIDGRIVFNTAWNDGLRVREALRQCAQGR
jgi:hypothetical protein